ncbi:MAG TPA: aldo/keto reductase [Tepidisphaeraceae bacterium]|jgi:aryl-alcohol dehydrogenase-like predicted oxidoreductase|nr:aldo/keto reductase [Tepidisphaeraceae bacterium]
MKYRPFGRLDWRISEIGFGAWAIGGSWGPQDEAESIKALHRALDLGVNFIDTAQGYGDGRSERIIGNVLNDRPQSKVYVATKIPPVSPGAWPPSPDNRIEERYPEKYLRERIERSLRDLQTDCIDLLQLHTWTRAWNRHPAALEVLQKIKAEGKIQAIGISTPEHDQNSLIDLMRRGLLDSVQVIYNIFEQEPRAEFLPAAEENKVAVIVRVAFDESALTGKLTEQTKFAEGDFRNNYFAGDRLIRTVQRVSKIAETIKNQEPNLATAALKFALKPTAVSTVIPGIRNVHQAEMNCAVSDLSPLSDDLELQLREHRWNRAFWYGGK